MLKWFVKQFGEVVQIVVMCKTQTLNQSLQQTNFPTVSSKVNTLYIIMMLMKMKMTMTMTMTMTLTMITIIIIIIFVFAKIYSDMIKKQNQKPKQNKTKQKTKQNKTKRNETRRNETKRNETKQNKNKNGRFLKEPLACLEGAKQLLQNSFWFLV